MLSDSDLVAGCLRGHRASERELFERFAPRMAAVCRRYAPDQDDMADLLQEGFIRTYEKLRQWQGGSLEGWMRRVFVSNCLNAYKKRRRRLALIEGVGEETDAPSTAQEFYDFLAADVIQTAIATLPEGARVIFNLFAIEGYPHTEIAQMLSISEGACRAQLTRARRLLQERLGPLAAPIKTTHDKLSPHHD